MSNILAKCYESVMKGIDGEIKSIESRMGDFMVYFNSNFPEPIYEERSVVRGYDSLEARLRRLVSARDLLTKIFGEPA